MSVFETSRVDWIHVILLKEKYFRFNGYVKACLHHVMP